MTRRAPTKTRLPADLREPFERLVADAAGEFGPTPLARLMAAHLPLFEDLHRRGASGAQTVHLLTEHGITGPNGPFTANVVRATYSRVRAAAAAAAKAAQRNEAQQVATRRNPTKQETVLRRPGGAPGDGARPTGTKRNAAERNIAHRHAADGHDAKGGEIESALHRRAALLNRQNGRR
jgi:hypothetical protein